LEPRLHKLAKELLEKEVLNAEELDEIVGKKKREGPERSKQ